MMASLNALLAKWLGSGVAATARLGWPLKLTGGALDRSAPHIAEPLASSRRTPGAASA